MKIPFPLPVALCLLAIAGPAGAENAGGTPVPAPRRIVRTIEAPPMPGASSAPVVADKSKLTRFDLDFPGGTPAELAAAISKATGKHLNLVIPPSLDDLKIGAMKVEGVTVPDVFAAISIVSSDIQAIPLRGSSQSFEFKDVVISFENPNNSSPATDETVWSLRSSGLNPKVIATVYGPPTVCRYFQLASYLENYSIEDITTAIQTGWKMAKVEPMPQLSFHKETSLLIAVGPESSVNQIPDVLSALRLDRGPAIEKIERLRAEGLEIEAKKAEGWQAKSQEIQKKISEIASRQRASEEIDNGGRRLIRPTPVGTN